MQILKYITPRLLVARLLRPSFFSSNSVLLFRSTWTQWTVCGENLVREHRWTKITWSTLESNDVSAPYREQNWLPAMAEGPVALIPHPHATLPYHNLLFSYIPTVHCDTAEKHTALAHLRLVFIKFSVCSLPTHARTHARTHTHTTIKDNQVKGFYHQFRRYRKNAIKGINNPVLRHLVYCIPTRSYTSFHNGHKHRVLGTWKGRYTVLAWGTRFAKRISRDGNWWLVRPKLWLPYYALFSRHFNFAIFRKSRKFDVAKIKCRQNLHARKLSDHTYKL